MEKQWSRIAILSCRDHVLGNALLKLFLWMRGNVDRWPGFTSSDTLPSPIVKFPDGSDPFVA
jgi:hypothetical protein